MFALACVTAGTSFAAEVAPLRIAWVDVSRAAPFAAQAARREILAVLEPLGVDARFRVAKPGADLQRGELSVVLLATEAPPHLRAQKVMGAVLATAGPERFAWIYLPEVMRALGFHGQSAVSLGMRDRRELGVALGRVVAHELLHLVAPDAPHAEVGLMAARLGREELVSARPGVDAATRDTVVPPRRGRAGG